MRRHRRGPDALLTRKLDVAWSNRVRSIGRCERCGRSDRRLDAHHYIGRSNYRTRWELANGVALCSWECHKIWAHNNPDEFVDWFRKHRPHDAKYLSRIKKEVSHWTIPDKEGMLADLLVPSAESEGMADE